MSGTPPLPPIEGAEDGPAARAGAYALGLMDPLELAAFEAELARDPVMAAELAFWRARLEPLLEVAPPVEPSVGLWERIEETIAGERNDALTRPAEPAVTGFRDIDRTARRTVPRDESGPAEARDERRGRLRDGTGRSRERDGPANDNLVSKRTLRVWQAATGLLAAASVALGLIVARPDPPPRFATVLVTDEGVPLFVVQGEADGSVYAIPVRRQDVPSNRAIELWTKRTEAQGPFSLGLVAGNEARSGRIRIEAPLPGQLFEVTLEPPGGSPVGRPTGTILAKGNYQM